MKIYISDSFKVVRMQSQNWIAENDDYNYAQGMVLMLSFQ